MSTFFVILPAVFLALYPTKIFKLVSRKLCSGRQRNVIFMFMNNFQGQYKDGTTGTYAYRSASCIGFMAKACSVWLSVQSMVQIMNQAIMVQITMISLVLIAISLFYAYVQPCRKRYVNILESLQYAIAAVLLIYIIHNNHFPSLFDIILGIILTPECYICVCYNIQSTQCARNCKENQKCHQEQIWRRE